MFRVAPDPVPHDPREDIDRLPDLLEAEVERGQAEADHVRRAEVADHAGGDQGLADFERMFVGEADVAAALLLTARGYAFEFGEPRLHQPDEDVEHGAGLGP